MKALLKRHQSTTIIWAHCGLGRVIHPVHDHLGILDTMLRDPAFNHVYFDISWDEVAKYLVATPATTKALADLINRYPTRFLFGTDEVAPKDQQSYLKVFDQYAPLWQLLSPEASANVRLKNYERIFDAARLKARAWEQREFMVN
jgi:predicted TIM-barrel fold metal-dependent hydrolase